MTTISIHSETTTPNRGFLFSFGAYGDTHVAILTDGGDVDDALELAFEWLDANAPGLLSWLDYEGTAKELGLDRENCSAEDSDRIDEAAMVDMTICGHTTLKNGDCIPSWEWTARELTAAELAEYTRTIELASAESE